MPGRIMVSVLLHWCCEAQIGFRRKRGTVIFERVYGIHRKLNSRTETCCQFDGRLCSAKVGTQ